MHNGEYSHEQVSLTRNFKFKNRALQKVGEVSLRYSSLDLRLVSIRFPYGPDNSYPDRLQLGKRTRSCQQGVKRRPITAPIRIVAVYEGFEV